jgi:hypothetical protein
LILAGLAGAALAWMIPWRLALPGVLLLSGPLAFRVIRQGVPGLVWRAYTWAWAWCCWLGAPPGWVRMAGLGLLSLGLLADAPFGAAAWQLRWRRSLPLAPAAVVAALFLAGMRVVAFGFTPSAGSTAVWEWALLGVGFGLGCLSAAAGYERPLGGERRWHLAFGLVAVVLAVLIAVRVGIGGCQPVGSALAPTSASVARPTGPMQTAVHAEAWPRAAVVFDGWLACLGAEVAPPAVARRGGGVTMRLTWFWETPPDPAWRVFAHVRRNLYGGVLYETSANLPAAGEGQPVRQELEVAIPPDAPAGDYVVLMGLWDGRANASAVRGGNCPAGWAVSRDGRVRVARIRVEPGTEP